MNDSFFTLEDIFDQKFLFSLKSGKIENPLLFQRITGNSNIPKSVISKICEATKLSFAEGSKEEGNVCFADNPDIRIEFRSSFTLTDLITYVFAHFPEEIPNPTPNKRIQSYPSRIPYPMDADYFWKMSIKGRSFFP